MKTSGELRNDFYKWLDDNPDGRVWDWMHKILKEEKSNQVKAQVSDDFGGQPLKLTGEELNTLIDLLEIFYDDHYDKLHTKLMNKKYEIVNNISQNSR